MRKDSMEKNSMILDKYSILDTGIFPKNKLSEDSRLPVNDEITICEEWLFKYTEPQKRYNDRHSSYGLKHQVEKWSNEYVSNGAFIFAAVSLKYPMKVLEDGPNAIFGIKLLTPEEKWDHVRPSGFTNWLFKRKTENTVIGGLANDAIADKNWPRKAKYFIEFWEYMNNISAQEYVIKSLCVAWEHYSGQKAPVPTDRIKENCERFYDGEVDALTYGGSYKNAPDGYTFIYVLFEEVCDSNKKNPVM